MRKLMLYLLSGVAMLGYAFEPQLQAPASVQAPMAYASEGSRADNSYTIRFCGDLLGWEGFEDASYDLVQYIYISPERATELAGNKITAIGYAPCLQGTSKDAKVKGTVFVSEDINAEPVYSMNINIENSYNKPSGSFFQEGSFTRSKQYEIKANTGFYIGFTMPCVSGDYPVALDKNAPGECAGTVDCYKDGVKVASYSVADTWEHNLLMYARTVGTASLGDAFSVGVLKFGDFTLPMFDNAAPLMPELAIANRGTTTLTSCEYTYSFDGGSPYKGAVDIMLAPGETGSFPLSISSYPAGRHTLEVAVDKINSTSAAGAVASADFFCVGDNGCNRRFVIEEGTGLWCQYCPLGIYCLEYMEEKYGDDFVGISVHSGDAFDVVPYLPIVNKFFIGFPMAVVNRDPSHVLSPYYKDVEALYNDFKRTKAPAEVALKVSADNASINVESSTKFCVGDPGKSYKLVFVVREDGLVGTQKNGFSGQKDDGMDYAGWEDKGIQVKWEFKHTARAIDECWGTDESKIDSPQAGEAYSYATKFSAKSVTATDGQRNYDNAYVIALLIEDETGVVVNAERVNIGVAMGVESVAADADPNAPAEYYNIQGQKVDTPRAGQLYIKVRGGKAEKVVL